MPEPQQPASPSAAPDPTGTRASAVSPAAETVKSMDVPTDAEPVRPDGEVEREAEAQIAEVPRAEAADVSVEVRDQIAAIEGTAPDRETATVIRDEVAHVDGVQGLEDRVAVEPGEASPSEPTRSSDEDDAA